MKFGQHASPREVNYSLPALSQEMIDRHHRAQIDDLEIRIGTTGYSGFPVKATHRNRGVRHSLELYSEIFDCIEFNATYYRTPKTEDILTWTQAVPDDFLFYPKLHKSISQSPHPINQLSLTHDFLAIGESFEQKLGSYFLQLPEHRTSQLAIELAEWRDQIPSEVPIAIECRHASWFENHELVAFAKMHIWPKGLYTVITDTPARRDLIPSLPPSRDVMLRFASTGNPEIDQNRLTAWFDRLKSWNHMGMKRTAIMLHSSNLSYVLTLRNHIKNTFVQC